MSTRPFKPSDLVRINPSIFPVGFSLNEMYGDLGYVGIFAPLIFRVKSILEDDNRRPVECEITNTEILLTIVPNLKEVEAQGTVYLLMKDLQHVDY